MANEKRTRRTPQQIAEDTDREIERLCENIRTLEEQRDAQNAEFERRIAAVNLRIKKLEDHKHAVLAPKPRKPRRTKAQMISEIVGKAQKSGMKLCEIADRLDVDLS